MGIQINGQTDRISAVDGSFSIQDLAEVNVTGVATASNFKSGTSNVHSTGYECTNINATGIVTAASANFTGNVSVGGTLTYQDVTNIDSVGIITARAGVKVPDNQKVFLGTDSDLEIYHDGSNARIRNTTGQLWLQSDNGIRFVDSDVNESTARFTDNGAVELYYDGTKKFETTSAGATITNDLVLNHASGDKAIRWATGGTNKWSLYHNNSAGALVAYDNANNAERLRITSAGNIGIGINNPAYELEVASSDTTTFNITAGGNTNLSRLFFSDDDAVARGYLNYDHQADNLLLATAGSERLRITSAGLVDVSGGIHVTENVTPTSGRGIEIFEAATGIGQISAFNRDGGSWDELRLKGSEVRIYAGTSNALTFDIQRAQSYLYGTSDGILNLDTTDGRGTFIRFKENGTTKAWVGCAEGMGGGTSSPDQDDLGLRATGNILFSSNGGERLRITENGRVLINRSTATDQTLNNLNADVKLVVNGATITKHGYKADVGTSYVSIPGATVGNETSVFLVTVQGNGGGNFHSSATYILCSGAYAKTFTQLGSAAGHFGNGVIQAQLSSYSGTSSSVQARRSGSSGTCNVQVHMLQLL